MQGLANLRRTHYQWPARSFGIDIAVCRKLQAHRYELIIIPDRLTYISKIPPPLLRLLPEVLGHGVRADSEISLIEGHDRAVPQCAAANPQDEFIRFFTGVVHGSQDYQRQNGIFRTSVGEVVVIKVAMAPAGRGMSPVISPI